RGNHEGTRDLSAPAASDPCRYLVGGRWAGFDRPVRRPRAPVHDWRARHRRRNHDWSGTRGLGGADWIAASNRLQGGAGARPPRGVPRARGRAQRWSPATPAPGPADRVPAPDPTAWLEVVAAVAAPRVDALLHRARTEAEA